MTTARRNFVTSLTVLFVGAHLLAIAAQIELWPVSYYSMFSRLHPPEICWPVLYGVTADGDEMKLQAFKYWRPFTATKLGTAMSRARARDEQSAREGKATTPTLPLAVAQAMENYERRRANSQHDGPPLAGLRLYEVTWRLDPALENLDRPLHRKLLVDHVNVR
jgi:hypothetical protein